MSTRPGNILAAAAFGRGLAFTAQAQNAASIPPEATSQAKALDPKLPALWIAGDSTAANGGANATGWGVPRPGCIDTAKLNVANRARGGCSGWTFVSEGLWDQLLAELKAGGNVLIQFGHMTAGRSTRNGPAQPGRFTRRRFSSGMNLDDIAPP